MNSTLSTLHPLVATSQKRVGRGYGSGVGGHTTGRGAKGDKVRGTNKLTFDGSKIKKSWIKRTPFLRGKHRVLAKAKPQILKIDLIVKYFKPNSTITPALLTKKLNINALLFKILSSETKLEHAYTFKGVEFSQKAMAQVVSAGGKIES
jgi:ribosomal protein L15